MPKINVYLPDDLADAVREAGIPVSSVCQRALEAAVRRVAAIREAAQSGAPNESDPIGGQSRFTDRARTVVRLAVERAKLAEAPGVGTEHLLAGILAEGANLAIRVLDALEISPEQVERELARDNHQPEPGSPPSFTTAAAAALESAVAESLALGHNYVGCEHLLLGLIAEPDGVAGHILRALGAEQRLARRAVAAAIAGYGYLQTQGQRSDPVAEVVRAQVQPLADRLARIEQHLGI